MFGLGWLTLRQAQEALDHGRFEEAHRLLSQPESVGHKGASALLGRLAENLVRRGEEHVRHHDAAAAWQDLVRAERTGAAVSGAARLRQALRRLAVDEARKLLAAGEPTRAAAALAQLQSGPAPAAEIQLLEEAARAWAHARELAALGEVGAGLAGVDRARQLLPETPAALDRLRKDLELRRPVLTGLVVQLHEAWAAERWRDVVRLAEQILAAAPKHEEARRARARAWKALEPAAAVSSPPMEAAESGRRFLLWVDGAGGYLVCLGPRVTLGQAAPDSAADVPLLADISRSHASVTRDSEGYLLEAARPLKVNGRSTDRALLQPGDRLTLGGGCELTFQQPVPVSASAVLELTSGHRLPLALDGVLLMAETLIIGPGPRAHAVAPDWEQPVVLFRQKDGIGVRCPAGVTVDGQPCGERGTLGLNSQVRGDDFAFAVEPVGERFGRAG